MLSTLNFSFKWSAFCLIKVHTGNVICVWHMNNPNCSSHKSERARKITHAPPPPPHTHTFDNWTGSSCLLLFFLCDLWAFCSRQGGWLQGFGYYPPVRGNMAMAISLAGGRWCVATTFSQRHQPVKRTKTSRLAWDVEMIRMGGFSKLQNHWHKKYTVSVNI